MINFVKKKGEKKLNRSRAGKDSHGGWTGNLEAVKSYIAKQTTFKMVKY